MKKLLFLSLTGLLLFSNLTSGQSGGTIDLKVADTAKVPLDGIMVQLVTAKDSAMVQYAFTGQDGSAQFNQVKNDRYRIYISQVGYINYFSSAFNLDDSHKQLSLPEIMLRSQSLKEVVIEGKTPVIQHFADKTVVNVDQSPLNAVGSIYDVLKRSPGVVIDQNENIMMQGKQNVMVMIDGRITPMSAADLANLLKGMPSESVEQIEFITHPSSKYDANGTAGIINIILKKNKAVGTNVSLNAGYSQGIYPRTNDGFSFSERTKKVNIFGMYNYSYRGSSNAINLQSNYFNGSKFESSTLQNEYLKIIGNTNMARVGADFFASDKTTIGFIADGSIHYFNVPESTNTYEYDSLHRVSSYDVTNSATPNNSYNYSGNLNLKHTFDSTGRELLVNIDYADYLNKGSQNVLTNYYNLDNTIESPATNLYGNLPGNLAIYSFKADYDGQLGLKDKLEAGVKSSYVKTDNNVMIYDGLNSSAPVDTTQSNHFIYSENINAAYITYSRSLPKADLQLGLRAEQTIAHGDQVTTGQEFTHNFTQLFPTLSVNDSLAKDQIVGISATRRIDRPTYDQLNPFRLYINPTFYLQGNPYLIPQNSYSLQLSDTYKQDYTLSIGYSRTANSIQTVILPFPGSPGIAEQTDENLTSVDMYTANLTIVQPIGKWLNMVISTDAYVSHYYADLASTPLNAGKFLWDINDNNSITLTKQLSLEVDGYYASGYDLGYLLIQSSWWAAAGLKLDVLKGKGSIKINANDIFWTDLTRATTTFTGFNQTIFVRRDTRFAGIAFTYHFGDSPASRSLHSKGGAEDEKNRANKAS
jgi:hypothetical protein